MAICCDTRLRVARAIAKSESTVAHQLMKQLKARTNTDQPPALATDSKLAYQEALVQTWGEVPPYKGQWRRPTQKKPLPGWQYLRVVKQRKHRRLVRVSVQVVYGDPETTRSLMGEHTAYVERSFLTSRHMNGRLVRKTLSYSKRLERLRQACAWEDAVYNFVRSHKALRLREDTSGSGAGNWQKRTPAMAAGLTDHIWTIKELLLIVAKPAANNLI